jgi:tRNA(adenine34) deaminase
MDASAIELNAMTQALDAARQAASWGDVPVGAVALYGGEVIAVAGNERERRQDPSAHAELLVLRDAAAKLGTWRLNDVTVVVTLEPCTMCAGAMVNARLGRLVYGATDLKAGAVGSRYNVLSDPRLNHEVETLIGVQAEACGALLKDFFATKRS